MAWSTDGILVSNVNPASGSAFSVLGDINPRNYWKASNAVGTTPITNLPDTGRIPKDMAPGVGMNLVGATNGYLAPNGTTQYLKAGVAADWTWLSNGTPWTMGMVLHSVGLPGTGYLLATYDGGGANGGMIVYTGNGVSASQWGVYAQIYKTALGFGLLINFRTLAIANTHVIVVRMQPLDLNTATAPIPLGNRGEMWGDGTMQAYQPSNTGSLVGFSAAAPTGNGLYMFSNTTPATFSGVRLYECFLEDRIVPTNTIESYMQYAATLYGAVS